MKKLLVAVLFGAVISAAAQEIIVLGTSGLTRVYKMVQLHLVAGDHLVIMINPTNCTAGATPALVNYTVPAGKSLNGTLNMSSIVR